MSIQAYVAKTVIGGMHCKTLCETTGGSRRNVCYEFGPHITSKGLSTANPFSLNF
jgi:hypothetical protein